MSNSKSPSLTVVLLVRDGAMSISESIASAWKVAEQVLVIDLGSRDKTAELAGNLGATVIQGPPDDRAAARNLAQQHTTTSWILWLDQGEVLADETAETLPEFLAQEASDKNVYLMPVQLPPAPGQSGCEQALQVRLSPVLPQLEFTHRVRESIIDSARAAGLELQTLDLILYRLAAEQDSMAIIRRATRELQLVELSIAAGETTAETWLVQGECLTALGQHSQALDCFQNAVDLAPRGTTVLLDAYYGLLTTCDQVPGAAQRQVDTSLAALEAFPLDAQLLCAMGGYMLRQNRIDLAIRSYSIAAEHGHIDPMAWHLSDIGEVAAGALSLTQQLAGDDEAALETVSSAIERFPYSQRLHRHAINLHIKHNRSAAALDQADLMLPIGAQRDALRGAVQGALLANEKQFAQAIPHLKQAYQSSCRDPICLRWLAISLLSVGEIEASEPIIRQWRELEPTNAEIKAYLEAIDEYRKSAPAIPPAAKETTERPRLRIDGAKEATPQRQNAPISPLPSSSVNTPTSV